MGPTPLPEKGQLVDVRQRRYLVTEIEASTLPTSPLKPASPVQNLITLTSVEDDAPGEELHVIWELEPGTRVHEKLALPESTDLDPGIEKGIQSGVRWGAASTADSEAAVDKMPWVAVEDLLHQPELVC